MINQRDEYILACTPGNYPWDGWERRARERGVEAELATLGRAVMREAYQHQWEPMLRSLCGWCDEGEAMIALALEHPAHAESTWRKLLETDGCRGSIHPRTGEWVSWL